MFCKKCGAQIEDDARFCPKCGENVNPEDRRPAAPTDPNVSPKSRLVAILLCYVAGCFGVHRFYVGRVGSGVAMIFTIGGLGIWALVDLIMIACGEFKDCDGLKIKTWVDQN